MPDHLVSFYPGEHVSFDGDIWEWIVAAVLPGEQYRIVHLEHGDAIVYADEIRIRMIAVPIR